MGERTRGRGEGLNTVEEINKSCAEYTPLFYWYKLMFYFSSNDSAVMMAKMELKKLNERERWKMEKEKRKVRTVIYRIVL